MSTRPLVAACVILLSMTAGAASDEAAESDGIRVGTVTHVARQEPRRLVMPNAREGRLASRIPDPLSTTGRYVWISGDEFVDEYGFLRSGLVSSATHLDPDDLAALHEEALAAFNEGSEPPSCMQYTNSLGQRPMGLSEPASSIDQLVARSAAVLHGTVASVRGGFFYKDPGVLLEIAVDRWTSSSEDYPESPRVFLFYPAGIIRIGRAELCVAHQGFPPAPRVGDEVLMLPDREAVAFAAAREHRIVSFASGPSGAGIYRRSDDGEVRASSELLAHLPSLRRAAFATVVAEIEAVVQRRSRR